MAAFPISLVFLLLCLLTVLIILVVHEAGHYLAARWCGVGVEVVSLGFGREAWGRTDRHGTRWRLSRLPFGGYVRMAGASAPGGLGLSERPVIARIFIMLAGPLANFVFTFLLLVILFNTVGENAASPDVTFLLPGTPGEIAGIRPGDHIVSVAGVRVQRFQEIAAILKLHAGQPIPVELVSDGVARTVTVTPRATYIPQRFTGGCQDVRIGIWHKGSIGAGEHAPIELLHFPPGLALRHAVQRMGDLLGGPVIALWRSVNDVPVPVMGAPPSMNISDSTTSWEMVRTIARYSVSEKLYFLTFLSVNFGLFNLIPFPSLDGGNIVLLLGEAWKNRRRRGG